MKNVKRVILCVLLCGAVIGVTACNDDEKIYDECGTPDDVSHSLMSDNGGTIEPSDINIDMSIFEYEIDGDCISINDYKAGDETVEIPSILCDMPVKEIGGTFEKSKAKNIKVADSVIQVNNYGFSNNKSLESITLPTIMDSIGYRAFLNCVNLKSVTMPKNMIELGEEAFNGCEKLESIVISDDIKTISCNAFKGCSSLKSVTVPDSVETISEGAFANCTSLKSIDLPNVTTIEEGAFEGCTNIILYSDNEEVERYCMLNDLNYMTMFEKEQSAVE